jgi:hypothetical protein
MVAGVRTNDLGLVAQCYATLHEGIFKLLDLIEVAIGYAFVAQGPQSL